MKGKKFYWLVVLLIVTILIGVDSYVYTLDQNTSGSSKVILKIDGMSCGGCEYEIEEALNSETGISNVDIDTSTESAWLNIIQTGLMSKQLQKK